MNAATSTHDSRAPGFWSTRYALGLLVLGGIASYFLLAEHRAHFVGALPFLLLLACPLMHVFMHNGHGGQGGHAGHQGSDAIEPAAQPTPLAGERP